MVPGGGGRGLPAIKALLARFGVALHPFDARQLQFARHAAIRYGKGRQPAAFDYNDCFTHALAKSEAVALLCTDADFAKTDVEAG